MDKQIEKLIELLKNSPMLDVLYAEDEEWAYVADYLLDNGVIVPPCKVGQTVYVVDVCAKEVIERKIMEIRQTEWGMIYIHSCGFGYPVTSIGKTVFLSREDAEKALKGVE